MNKPTYKFYKKKIRTLLKEQYHYLLTGIFVVGIISTISILQFKNNNILGVFSYDSSEDSPIRVSDKTEAVMKAVLNESIDYVSPSVSMEKSLTSSSGLSRPEENGQISAIASDRVTNTADKYVVKVGDSLATIALEVYGDVNAWIRIAQANNITNPDNVEVGMTLVIPR